MANSRDRVLLVENDTVVSDLIGRQVLQASGYQVFVASDASTAISKALQWSPDLIITDLNLPGLSGKDLMVALSSQGIQVPVIILAQRGLEADIMQTFRLGAADYLLLPVREAEVVSAVERVLRQGHDRRERERLALQLQQTNQELQSRVRELTTIFSVGKAVTSVTDQASLLEKVLDAAVRVTQADLGWFLLREDVDKPFMVVAQHNLPPALGVRTNQPWDDGISSLVAMSGEVLAIHGEPLKRFKIYGLGPSALIVPIKVQKKVIGLLSMMRRQPNPFAASEQHLLDALADYASISLVNARLFKAVEERARALQQAVDSTQKSGKLNYGILDTARKEITPALTASFEALDKLVKDPTARWRPDQRQLFAVLQDQLTTINQVVASISSHRPPQNGAAKARIALGEAVRGVVQKMQPFAQQSSLSIVSELPSAPVFVYADGEQIAQALEGLFSILIRCSNQGAIVGLRMGPSGDQAHILMRSSNLSVDPKDLAKMFEQPSASAGRGAGVSIHLNLVKEIVTAEGGKVWLENESGKDTIVHLVLPLAQA